MTNFFTIVLTLFFVIDALGNLPIYLALLKTVDKKKQLYVAIRELLIALAIMFLFHYVGLWLLSLLGISKPTIHISGGLVLFIIAIRLIFSNDEVKWEVKEPFIVPIATPIIAGPSVLTVIMFFSQEESSDWIILLAILTAWFISSMIFLFGKPIHRLFKDTGLEACQRLMGLIVALIAVQKFLEGVEGLLK